MDDVQKAEDYGNQRAAIFVMMALILLASAGLALKTARESMRSALSASRSISIGRSSPSAAAC